jgi:hypothetical protein
LSCTYLKLLETRLLPDPDPLYKTQIRIQYIKLKFQMILYNWCSYTYNSTTVIVNIKGKPRSLFCNKRTVIGKMMHIIIYKEHTFVELICENKNVLVNFTPWI